MGTTPTVSQHAQITSLVDLLEREGLGIGMPDAVARLQEALKNRRLAEQRVTDAEQAARELGAALHASEQSRLEIEQKHDSLFDRNPDAVFSVDPQGRLTSANPACVRVTGYGVDELLKMSFQDLCAPDQLEKTLANFRQCLIGNFETLETALIRKDGRRAELLVHGGPIVIGGKLIALHCAAKDVTQRKNAEAALRDRNEQLQAIADTMMAFLEDANWQEASARLVRAALKQTRSDCGFLAVHTSESGALRVLAHEGITWDPVLWRDQFDDRVRSFAQLGYIEFTNSDTLFADCIRTGHAVICNDPPSDPRGTRTLPPGHPPICSFLGVPFFRGQRVIGMIGVANRRGGYSAEEEQHVRILCNAAAVLYDSYRRQQRESALHEQNQEARRQLEEANHAKDRFLAVLSHELRTPLTPVLTSVQMLEREPNLPESQRELVQMIRRNVELETRLIDDLLDLTRISRGKLELFFAPTDLHAKIRQVISICDSDIRSKQLFLTTELDAPRFYVRADAARLQQVLWNLLKNAVKFTPGGASIGIKTRNEGQRLLIEIWDTGIGIEADRLPGIFDAFEQGSRDITQRHGGLGLGLTISRWLVEAHDGTIRAFSEGPGMGSVFTLDLPLTAAPEPPRPEAPRQGEVRSSGRHRLLLVEDNADTTRAMKRLLTLDGYAVHTADCVAAALRAAEGETFDLIICDIGLPDGSGLDLMRQLRAKRPTKAIALSGYGMEEDINRSKAAGFLEHLTKPVNLQRLEDTIRRIIEQDERV